MLFKVAVFLCFTINAGICELNACHANCEQNPENIITTYTCDREDAGTFANVKLTVKGEGGEKADIILTRSNSTTLFRKSVDNFCLTKEDSTLFEPHEVELSLNGLLAKDNWCVLRIEVKYNGHSYIFPVNRWIVNDQSVKVRLYDCLLPQHDPNRDQRRKEIEAAKPLYVPVEKLKECPRMAKEVPADGKFPEETKALIYKELVDFSLEALVKNVPHILEPLETVKDIDQIYFKSLYRVETADYWYKDEWFALKRLQGVHPLLITLCKQLPPRFNGDKERMKRFLEGKSVEEALEENKLFYFDLHVLSELFDRNDGIMSAPMAFFYLNSTNSLMPVAIQLKQEKNSPVFYPDDEKYVWLTAKLFCDLGDATYHEGVSHLGWGHLLPETIVLAAHRTLSMSHPMMRLMMPHFFNTLDINNVGFVLLLTEGKYIDVATAVKTKGFAKLMAHEYKNTYNLSINGNPRKHLELRGVADPEILPNYLYRDDSTRLYDIINRYVTKVVNSHYKSDADVIADEEMNEFRTVLGRPFTRGGFGVRGIPGSDESGFATRDEIIETVTNIISTNSLGHAAVNFLQYEHLGFPLNFPQKLQNEVLSTKDPLTERDLVGSVAPRIILVQMLSVMKLLSLQNVSNSIGNFEVQYLFSPSDVEAQNVFRQELAKLSASIDKRNRNLKYPYWTLNPKIVPNSVSI